MSHCLNPDCVQPQNPSDHRFCQRCGWPLRLGDRYEAVSALKGGQNSRTFVGRDRTTLVQPQCLIKHCGCTSVVRSRPTNVRLFCPPLSAETAS